MSDPASVLPDLDRPVVARATFRLPLISLFFPLLILFCTVPLASYRVWFAPFYLIPVAALAYVLMTSTVVTSNGLTARTPLRRRRVSWSDLSGFEFHGPRWAVAVTSTGQRFRLPMIRPRDLPTLAAVSGGRLNLTPRPDPVASDTEDPEPAAASANTEDSVVVDDTAAATSDVTHPTDMTIIREPPEDGAVSHG